MRIPSVFARTGNDEGRIAIISYTLVANQIGKWMQVGCEPWGSKTKMTVNYIISNSVPHLQRPCILIRFTRIHGLIRIIQLQTKNWTGVIEWFVELLFSSDGIIMRYHIQYFRIYPISEFNADHQDKESGHLQVCGNRGTQTTEIELHCKTEKAVSL